MFAFFLQITLDYNEQLLKLERYSVSVSLSFNVSYSFSVRLPINISFKYVLLNRRNIYVYKKVYIPYLHL